MLQIKVGPGYYLCEQTILSSLEEKLQERGIRRVYVLHGEKSLEAAKPYLPSFDQMEVFYGLYKGHCTDKEVARHQLQAAEFKADCILGIGGGTAMDLTKACAHEMNIDTILIPTLASTCAPWSTLSVFYNEQGEFIRYDSFPKGIGLVLIEPEIIAQSPIQYLRAGIGDTIAKWYEAEVLTRDLEDLRIPVKLALDAAQTCRDALLTHGGAALDSLKQKKVTNELIQVIETNIVAGGLVGGLGDNYGRIAAAHSIHNGLTIFPETICRLHGEKVAYGILVQLGIEKNWEEINRLIPYYQMLGLPVKLHDIGLRTEDKVLDALVTRALAVGESIHYMSNSPTSDELKQVILNIEKLMDRKEGVVG
ncbi:iron-containing alcohol dehydrogenase family protein [Alkalicoccobacillus porphyridii]|uniref:Iron-containing alcohol dehydrogenase family protein n=1 Tax=Alkalicoccobacillus porphyridii TaxID=2597270 RepID=A0A553ZTJ8_9BACI|nr:iron-containing alcohol dehydrogenase family protein [Alkalicoccobacillus porphyridii]TSB44782.1 iron-containing alcohol dehydrogenase family protein [Alkalicoccobacillus porphyridii]